MARRIIITDRFDAGDAHNLLAHLRSRIVGKILT
jgi:hypothetical protein